jgi:2-hydroxychromene-2-carboxylate isomerase
VPDQTLSFYFDFMSPFAYLAFQRVGAICDEFSLGFEPVAVRLPQLKLLAGNTGPPNVRIPVKLRYLRQDLDRWAARYGVPLAFPPSLDTDPLNRAFFFAADRGQGEGFMRAAWERVWGRGEDPADPALLPDLAARFGWDGQELAAYAGGAEAAARLERATEAAHRAGVFGVPTMVVDGQMWWGNDRLDLMREMLGQQAAPARS